MNTVAHQRALNTLLGVVLALFGCLFWAGGAYVFLHPPGPSGPPRLVDMDVRSCTKTLGLLGHTVERKGDELIVTRPATTFENAERMLADSSLGISACSLPVASFCMGPGCVVPGVSFALNTKAPALLPKPSASSTK